MTHSQIAGLASATIGAVGTVILFFASYSVQPLEGAPFAGPILDVSNAKIKAKNANRILRQRIGLACLCASFAVQAVGVFL